MNGEGRDRQAERVRPSRTLFQTKCPRSSAKGQRRLAEQQAALAAAEEEWLERAERPRAGNARLAARPQRLER